MIRILISIPLLIVLIAFALSNQQPVDVGIWPTDIRVAVPLSVAVLVGAGLAFVFGALMTWTGGLGLRARARRAERKARALQGQLDTLQVMQADGTRGPGGGPGMVGTSQAVALLPPS